MADHDPQPRRPPEADRRRHELRCYVNDSDRALIREAARDEGVSVSEYLRLCALMVAREVKGMEVFDTRELVAAVLNATRPADA